MAHRDIDTVARDCDIIGDLAVNGVFWQNCVNCEGETTLA